MPASTRTSLVLCTVHAPCPCRSGVMSVTTQRLCIKRGLRFPAVRAHTTRQHPNYLGAMSSAALKALSKRFGTRIHGGRSHAGEHAFQKLEDARRLQLKSNWMSYTYEERRVQRTTWTRGRRMIAARLRFLGLDVESEIAHCRTAQAVGARCSARGDGRTFDQEKRCLAAATQTSRGGTEASLRPGVPRLFTSCERVRLVLALLELLLHEGGADIDLAEIAGGSVAGGADAPAWRGGGPLMARWCTAVARPSRPSTQCATASDRAYLRSAVPRPLLVLRLLFPAVVLCEFLLLPGRQPAHAVLPLFTLVWPSYFARRGAAKRRVSPSRGTSTTSRQASAKRAGADERRPVLAEGQRADADEDAHHACAPRQAPRTSSVADRALSTSMLPTCRHRRRRRRAACRFRCSLSMAAQKMARMTTSSRFCLYCAPTLAGTLSDGGGGSDGAADGEVHVVTLGSAGTRPLPFGALLAVADSEQQGVRARRACSRMGRTIDGDRVRGRADHKTFSFQVRTTPPTRMTALCPRPRLSSHTPHPPPHRPVRQLLRPLLCRVRQGH